MSRLALTIEAILYLKAQPLSIAQISEFAACDRRTVEEGLMELLAEYAHRDSALEIVETDQGYSLQLRDTYQSLIHTLVPADLGVGALRTLAVIALKGPIAQTELVDIRGSGVYQHIPELVELGFVRKRKRSEGRSPWVQVTDKFHQYFQLNQLPQGISELIRRRTSSAADDSADSPAVDAPESDGSDRLDDSIAEAQVADRSASVEIPEAKTP